MRCLVAILLSLTFVSVGSAAAPPASPRKERSIREALDLRYHPGKGRQTLDVFSPVGRPGERFPVVVFVHGGTWMYGDKNFFGLYRGVGRFLAKHGVVAVMVNYRLSPGVKHPEHARDVARAFAWTCRKIDSYGGDPTRIILAGHSAGAHLASLVATDETYLKDPELKLSARDRAGLRGVASVCGVYRIPGPDEFRKMSSRIVTILVERNAPSGMAGLLTPVLLRAGEALNPFALVFGTDREVQTKASPLSHVRKGLPPFLLLNAEREVPGLAAMAEDFAAALRKAGDSVQTRTIEGSTHRSILFGMHQDRSEAGQALLDFVFRHTARGGSRES
jgi:acetyl esterase/lipase